MTIDSRYGLRVAAACFAAVAAVLAASGDERAEPSIPPVVIDYFFEAGCPECTKVQNEVMPALKDRFEGLFVLREHDVGVLTNYLLLAAYQQRLGMTGNEPVCMVVDQSRVLEGFRAISTGLLEQVEQCATERLEPGWKAPIPEGAQAGTNAVEVLTERVRGFTLRMVLFNGLLDGINPCAIGTLVFFVSLLAASRVKGTALLAMGVSFCVASFVTYTALGFGLFRVLRTLAEFPMIQAGVEVVMVGILAVFSFLSFRDAWRYARTQDPDSVSLQLPRRLKQAAHSVMRRGLGAGNLAIGGLLIGSAVTVLESVCTGQVYLPTLVVLVKTGREMGLAVPYLLLYNAMFVLPLSLVFVLAYFGLRTETFLLWSRRNVVAAKVLLGIFFVVMALLILVT